MYQVFADYNGNRGIIRQDESGFYHDTWTTGEHDIYTFNLFEVSCMLAWMTNGPRVFTKVKLKNI